MFSTVCRASDSWNSSPVEHWKNTVLEYYVGKLVSQLRIWRGMRADSSSAAHIGMMVKGLTPRVKMSGNKCFSVSEWSNQA